MSTRVMVATHSHPALSKGGAELAAWHLYQGLQDQPGWESWLLGCTRTPSTRSGSMITQPFGPREFLYASSTFDWFNFANQDEDYPRELAAMLRHVRPDVLHFHHYVNFGVETFLLVRRTLPDCKIILTLHEFQAICNHYGQMVTRTGHVLCHAATLRDCVKCFPERSQADFFLRRAFIQRFLALVDGFVAPSHFLAQRYIEWGVPAERMHVISNVQAQIAPPPTAANTPDTMVLRVGFFGQISPLKGINVLLDAATLLADAVECPPIVIDIHGDHSNQPAEFQADLQARLSAATRNVRYHGPYDNTRVDQLMSRCDLVVVPSIWWENAPVVIQEALRNRRPILCSDIGGMAEKVRDGRDGWHFPVGNAVELAARLLRLAQHPEDVAQFGRGMDPSRDNDALERHVALYRSLAQNRATTASTPEP